MATEDKLPRSAALREALEKGKNLKQAPVVTVSVNEACEQIGICRTTLYKLIRSKKIRSMKVERRRLFDQRAIQQFIEQRENEEAEA